MKTAELNKTQAQWVMRLDLGVETKETLEHYCSDHGALTHLSSVLVWAGVSGLRIVSNTFSHVRIAVRHHNSLGTAVVNNRGSYVSIGVYADSRLNLTQSGNAW